ncbi:methyltransferase family protein [Halopolyspora algeriensis]|uniref:Methyltransferase family protein n=1 Tax=Halopolyspora algeriensis TaxID=1500506 RepID=A0A368VRC8_9ACTN|nr:class I SAM-dependent methyltransferase [Halopolyspora algeriensis]RCW44470.1 methyltransferase family protein [Halopolyspora algeriensis]TQM55831.1 methyltransferase family protein [Halopolyspora algeriensis]
MDAHDWDERYRETALLWTAGPNRWVEQHTAELPPGRALDLAAGEGRNALWLAERGWQVTAVDFSAVGMDKARELAESRGGEAAGRVRWVVEDVLSHTPGGQYDLVLVVYLHLPAEQRRTALQRAASALAPGGTLLVVGHHSDNLTHGVGGPPDPAVLYDEHDVLADLSSWTELTTETAEKRERAVADQPRPALDVVVEFRRAAS